MNWFILLFGVLCIAYIFTGGKIEKTPELLLEPAKLKSGASRIVSNKLIVGIIIGISLFWLYQRSGHNIEGRRDRGKRNYISNAQRQREKRAQIAEKRLQEKVKKFMEEYSTDEENARRLIEAADWDYQQAGVLLENEEAEAAAEAAAVTEEEHEKIINQFINDLTPKKKWDFPGNVIQEDGKWAPLRGRCSTCDDDSCFDIPDRETARRSLIAHSWNLEEAKYRYAEDKRTEYKNEDRDKYMNDCTGADFWPHLGCPGIEPCPGCGPNPCKQRVPVGSWRGGGWG